MRKCLECAQPIDKGSLCADCLKPKKKKALGPAPWEEEEGPFAGRAKGKRGKARAPGKRVASRRGEMQTNRGLQSMSLFCYLGAVSLLVGGLALEAMGVSKLAPFAFIGAVVLGVLGKVLKMVGRSKENVERSLHRKRTNDMLEERRRKRR